MDGLQVALSVTAEGAVIAAGLLTVRAATEVVSDVTLIAKRAERAGARACVALRTSIGGRAAAVRGLVTVGRTGTTGDQQDGDHQTCCYCEYCDESLHSDHLSRLESRATPSKPLAAAEPHLADTNALPERRTSAIRTDHRCGVLPPLLAPRSLILGMVLVLGVTTKRGLQCTERL